MGALSRVSNPREIFKRRTTIGLRMAPMIDVIFLLLLFFLVAAKWKPREDFFPMQLASAGVGAQNVGRTEPLVIQISQNEAGCLVRIGSLYSVQIPLQNPEAGLAELMTKARQCLVEQKRYAGDPVEIACAADVKWEYLAKIYNVFVGMGLNDITFRMTGESSDESAR